MKTLQLSDGTVVPVLGQGTWTMGDRAADRADEVRALKTGIDLGMTLIDTAEMYGAGAAEEVVADAIASRRDEVFIVTKVYPHNATRRGLPAACERSLRRLRITSIDLYLLHWRTATTQLGEMVEAFERLRDAGKIRRWGVSNFDSADLEELDRPDCVVDQVLYNPEHRGIEHDLLPWCGRHDIAVMAYSPLGQGRLVENAVLAKVASRHQATPAQVALAWALRQRRMMAIPKARKIAHVRANAAALDLRLEPQDLAMIDRAFPPPQQKERLQML